MLPRLLYLAAVASVLVTSSAGPAPVILGNEALSVQTRSRPFIPANYFHPDNFAVYDWVTRVLNPYVKLLPLLVLMVMISQAVVCLSLYIDGVDDADCYFEFHPDYDNFARSVRSAIDRQRAMYER